MLNTSQPEPKDINAKVWDMGRGGDCIWRAVPQAKSGEWLLTIQFSLPWVLDNNRKYIDGAEIFLSGRIWVKRLITSVT